MTTEQKSLPMAEPTYITGYSHPPRLKEGARKAIVIRNIICESDGRILLKKEQLALSYLCELKTYMSFSKSMQIGYLKVFFGTIFRTLVLHDWIRHTTFFTILLKMAKQV